MYSKLLISKFFLSFYLWNFWFSFSSLFLLSFDNLEEKKKKNYWKIKYFIFQYLYEESGIVFIYGVLSDTCNICNFMACRKVYMHKVRMGERGGTGEEGGGGKRGTGNCWVGGTIHTKKVVNHAGLFTGLSWKEIIFDLTSIS